MSKLPRPTSIEPSRQSKAYRVDLSTNTTYLVFNIIQFQPIEFQIQYGMYGNEQIIKYLGDPSRRRQQYKSL